MKKILSVSVASYNLGEMIVENIESFCKSKVAKKVELIITDDGSRDDTPKIIEKYAEKYPNTIVFVKKKNEGPGSTVNSGIRHATGKYFRMVDGDDWVKTENLEDFVKLLEQTDVDMVVSNYEIFDNEQKQVIETTKYNLAENEILSIDNVYGQVPYQMHGLTFKTEIFKNNDICLDNCFYTDVEYTLFPVPYVKTIEYFNNTIYMYRVAQATQSVNPNSMKKNLAQHDLVLNHIIEYFNLHCENMSKGQIEYTKKRISDMMDVQLSTMLLFDVSKEQKIKIKTYVQDMKVKCLPAYSIWKKSKKLKSLVYSNYLLYPFVAKKYCKMISK